MHGHSMRREHAWVWPSVHLLPLLEHSCGPARALRREHGSLVPRPKCT